MKLENGDLLISASDLSAHLGCQHRTQLDRRTDVLLRVEEPSPALGEWSYLVVDTKLASETRAGTVLQLCLYTRIVGEIQGVVPRELCVVSPGKLAQPERFRTTDYSAFARRMERQLCCRAEASRGASRVPILAAR